ncbi:YqaJ viral recombinase family protein [Leucobacter sp. NPDC015123]|uniref:YqaJ viral recombinase family protein n=1 Tax=Leucobacter sp. NPDC015123 TaxID=3364129 RepID=UPI0036F46384
MTEPRKYEVVEVVSDSPEWAQERRNSLGASEVAAVLGLSPYATALDVYRSKKGVDTFFDPERAAIGHEAEKLMQTIIEKFRPEFTPVLPAQMVRSVECPWLHASLDRRLTVDGIDVPVQMKTAHFYGVKDWEDGTPILVQAQLQTEMFVYNRPFGYSALLGGDMRFRLFRVERDDEFIQNHLIPATREFWHEHVLKDVPPPATTTAEHASLHTPDPDRDVELTDLLVEALDRRDVLLSDALALEKEAKVLRAEADETQVAVLNYAGAAQNITHMGEPIYEIKPVKGRRSVSVADVENLHPELYDELVKTGAGRNVLRKVKK